VVEAATAAIVRSGFPHHEGLRKELLERPVLPWPGVHFFWLGFPGYNGLPIRHPTDL